MFSAMVIIGNSARCWNTMFTGRLLGGVSSTERPLILMSPEVGSRKPAIIRMIVVLPQPDGPRIEKKLPGGTEKETLSTAVVSSNRFTRSTHARSGVIAGSGLVAAPEDRVPPVSNQLAA